MKRKPGARELELRAASAAPKHPVIIPPTGEAIAMLARRGLHPEKTAGSLPLPEHFDEALADKFSQWLDHYAFRLFLRGAILKPKGFLPGEATHYVETGLIQTYLQALLDLGLAEKARRRYRLRWPAKSFGDTLEWYVGRELARRHGFDVACRVKLHVPGAGGDLDVVAAAEGKLLYLELKSSPPRNISASEITAFCDRVWFVRPDLAFFVVDTALRLSDKILPMFLEEFARRGWSTSGNRRIAGELWALTSRLYLVNGNRDLMMNIGKAIAAGFRAIAPEVIASIPKPPVERPQD
jgi:hypothetical protein